MSAIALVPENPLERALVRAAEDPTARPAFYRALLESDVYVLLAGVPARPVARIARDGERAQLLTWSVAGGAILPMFSSVNRISQVAAAKQSYAAMRGQAAFKMLAGQPHKVVLNPGFSCGKEFVPEEIRALADGSFFAVEPVRQPGGDGAVIGPLARPPNDLIPKLKSFFVQEPSVAAAYVAEIDDPSSGLGPHPIVALACDEGDFGPVAGRIGVLLRELALGDGPVDVTAIDAGWLGEYFRREVKPFYVRWG